MRKKIRIRNNSWHYRFYSRFHGTVAEPTDLCSYARGLLSAMFLEGTYIILMLASLVMLVAILVGSIMSYPTGTGIVFVSLVAIVGLIFASIKLGPKINKKFLAEDSLTGAYLKAKKEKYCPLVEVVNSEQEKANG